MPDGGTVVVSSENVTLAAQTLPRPACRAEIRSLECGRHWQPASRRTSSPRCVRTLLHDKVGGARAAALACSQVLRASLNQSAGTVNAGAARSAEARPLPCTCRGAPRKPSRCGNAPDPRRGRAGGTVLAGRGQSRKSRARAVTCWSSSAMAVRLATGRKVRARLDRGRGASTLWSATSIMAGGDMDGLGGWRRRYAKRNLHLAGGCW